MQNMMNYIMQAHQVDVQVNIFILINKLEFICFFPYHEICIFPVLISFTSGTLAIRIASISSGVVFSFDSGTSEFNAGGRDFLNQN